MLKEQLDKTVLAKLKLPLKAEPDLEHWKGFLGHLPNPTSEVRIGVIWKYVELPDAYKSITEAFLHAGAQNECKVSLNYIHSALITIDNAGKTLGTLQDLLFAPSSHEISLVK